MNAGTVPHEFIHVAADDTFSALASNEEATFCIHTYFLRRHARAAGRCFAPHLLLAASHDTRRCALCRRGRMTRPPTLLLPLEYFATIPNAAAAQQ